jgi:BlaI family transcriptional regulator, penicillinase repressor
MARRSSRTLTEVELEFMHLLWAKGELTPDDFETLFTDSGKPLTGGSIRKVLGILLRKGYVDRRREGKGYTYFAKVPREQAGASVVRDILSRVFGGSASLLVAALLDNRSVPEKDLETIENLIAEKRKEKEK